ncbi:hypothetical protein Tco_0060195 [Tanacetum coccineum]
MKCVTMDTIKPKVPAPGMYAIDVELIPPHSRNNRKVHLDYLKHLKESVETLWEIVEEARIEKSLDNALESACFYTKRSQELLEYVIGTCPKQFSKRDKKAATTPLTRKKQVTFKETCKTSHKNTQAHVVQIVLWYLDSGCSKHMTGNHSRLKNFMKKFIRTITFGNDHFGAIMGYEDYVIDLKVAFRKHSCYVRDVDGVELLKGCRGSNLYTIFVEDIMKSCPICLMSKASKNKSWLWHHQCLIHTRHIKTSYGLVHSKKLDLTFLCVFGALCYPINDNEDLGKLKAKSDIGIFIGYAPNKKGLVPNPVLAAPYVPPTNKDLEILFQLMFDEYFEPSSVERLVPPAPVVQVPVVSAGTPSFIIIDQDAPSISHSS